MRAQEFISELFQPGKDWKWSFTGSQEAVAVFHVGSIPYQFYAYRPNENFAGWDVEFKNADRGKDRTAKFGLTGTGNSAEVMSTIADIMREFLTKYQGKITELTFTADEPSRRALYTRMAKRLLPTWELQQDGKEFKLVAPETVGESGTITEGLNHPVIVVDVQPAYEKYNPPVFQKIVNFVNKQTGPVLMFVNAERDGMTDDTVESVYQWWDETAGIDYDQMDDDPNYTGPTNWDRFTIIDKGYGWFRSWMDQGVQPKFIIQLIRYMYQNGLNDIQDDLDGVYQYMTNNPVGGQIVDWQDWMEEESFIINWTSVAQLKKFNGSYLVGGGRDECLREIELLMNAFNIKYKRIDSLVY